MKNQTLLCVLMTSAVLLACRPTSQNADPANQGNCYANTFDPQNTSVLNLISFTTAIDMSNRYAQDQQKSFVYTEAGVKTQTQDATSITFPIEQLKAFIELSERAICAGECNRNTPLALRFYYGKYPDSTRMQQSPDLKMLPMEYENHHTLFLVPLYQSTDGQWVEFNPIEKKIVCDSPTPIIQTNTKPGFLALGLNQSPEPGNHGGLRPPPYEESQGTFPQN